MATYLLAHDLGTSGNKATLYTTDGELVNSVVASYPTNYFNNNWAEQDAEDWWRAVCNSTTQILRGLNNQDVAAVSFSGQMMGCLCVDRRGVPLRKAIIWADQRAEREVDTLRERLDEREFYRITGNRLSPSYGLAKLLWVKNNEPETYRQTHKMLHAKDYIVFKLTGRFVTDHSDASGTNLFDLNTFEWSENILAASGIAREKLPELRPSTFVAGEVGAAVAEQTGLAKGTPVVCGGGDGVCAGVGAGSVKEGVAYNYIGSSSWIALTTKQPVYDPEMRTFNFAHIIPGYISPCGTMQAAGSSYSWLKTQLCQMETEIAKQQGVSPYDLINRQIAASPPGANGLLYLPYLLGERSPRWDSSAKGAFIGLKMEHRRADVYRAVLEGITLNLALILEVFKQHVPIREMIVIGGGAQGEVWRQIMADAYRLNILKPHYLEEATSMGAAITGGVGAGVFQNFDVIDRFLKIETTQMPIDANVRVYEKLLPIFDASYHALKGIFRDLAAF